MMMPLHRRRPQVALVGQARLVEQAPPPMKPDRLRSRLRAGNRDAAGPSAAASFFFAPSPKERTRTLRRPWPLLALAQGLDYRDNIGFAEETVRLIPLP